eukprot:2942831-Prorocentrum_lima.AAC.1
MGLAPQREHTISGVWAWRVSGGELCGKSPPASRRRTARAAVKCGARRSSSHSVPPVGSHLLVAARSVSHTFR